MVENPFTVYKKTPGLLRLCPRASTGVENPFGETSPPQVQQQGSPTVPPTPSCHRLAELRRENFQSRSAESCSVSCTPILDGTSSKLIFRTLSVVLTGQQYKQRSPSLHRSSSPGSNTHTVSLHHSSAVQSYYGRPKALSKVTPSVQPSLPWLSSVSLVLFKVSQDWNGKSGTWMMGCWWASPTLY